LGVVTRRALPLATEKKFSSVESVEPPFWNFRGIFVESAPNLQTLSMDCAQEDRQLGLP